MIRKYTPTTNIFENNLEDGLAEIDKIEAYHLMAQPTKTLFESCLLIRGLLTTAGNAASESPISKENISVRMHSV